MWLSGTAFSLIFISVQAAWDRSISIPAHSGSFEVKWTSTAKEITFEVSAPTTGWVALGFNSVAGNELQRADLYIAWVTGSQKYFQDAWLEPAYSSPQRTIVKDNIQNAEIVDSVLEETDGSTRFRFKRRLNTCDSNQDIQLTTSTVNLIMAYGSADIVSTGANPPVFQPYFLEVKPVLLLEKDVVPGAASPAISRSWNMTVSNVFPLERGAVAYSCKLFRLDDGMDSFVGYSPIISGQSGSPSSVNSIRAYLCPKNFTSLEAHGFTDGQRFSCAPDGGFSYSESVKQCQELLATWAPGNEGTWFPPKTGYILKTGYGGRTILLQVAYSNPVPRNGETGLSFHLSPDAIDQNLGFFTVTADKNYRLIIPPNSEDFRIRTICDSQCTKSVSAARCSQAMTAKEWSEEVRMMLAMRVVMLIPVRMRDHIAEVYESQSWLSGAASTLHLTFVRVIPSILACGENAFNFVNEIGGIRCEILSLVLYDSRFMYSEIPPSGILVTAVQHNTRALGSQVRTRLIRNGKEVQTLTDDYVHSSTFQPLRSITPVKILAGDQIIVECSFNTQTAANSWAFGGYGTKSRQNDQSADEVCEALFQYYPRIENFDVCGSVPEARHIYPIFRISDYEREFEGNYIAESDLPVNTEIFRSTVQRTSFHRDDQCFRARLQDLYFNKRHQAFCGTDNLKHIHTSGIELLPLNSDGQCPGTVLSPFSYNWTSSCFDIIFRDEIENQIYCKAEGNSGLRMSDNKQLVIIATVLMVLALILAV